MKFTCSIKVSKYERVSVYDTYLNYFLISVIFLLKDLGSDKKTEVPTPKVLSIHINPLFFKINLEAVIALSLVSYHSPLFIVKILSPIPKVFDIFVNYKLIQYKFFTLVF